MFWAEQRAEPWFVVCHAGFLMLATLRERLGGLKGLTNLAVMEGAISPLPP